MNPSLKNLFYQGPFFQTFPKVKIFEPGFFFFFFFFFFFKKKYINFNSYKSNLIEIGIVNVNDCLELLDGTLGVLCQILFFGTSKLVCSFRQKEKEKNTTQQGHGPTSSKFEKLFIENLFVY